MNEGILDSLLDSLRRSQEKQSIRDMRLAKNQRAWRGAWNKTVETHGGKVGDTENPIIQGIAPSGQENEGHRYRWRKTETDDPRDMGWIEAYRKGRAARYRPSDAVRSSIERIAAGVLAGTMALTGRGLVMTPNNAEKAMRAMPEHLRQVETGQQGEARVNLKEQYKQRLNEGRIADAIAVIRREHNAQRMKDMLGARFNRAMRLATKARARAGGNPREITPDMLGIPHDPNDPSISTDRFAQIDAFHDTFGKEHRKPLKRSDAYKASLKRIAAGVLAGSLAPGGVIGLLGLHANSQLNRNREELRQAEIGVQRARGDLQDRALGPGKSLSEHRLDEGVVGKVTKKLKRTGELVKAVFTQDITPGMRLKINRNLLGYKGNKGETEMNLKEHYKQRLEQRMLEEGFLGNLASRVTAPMRGAIKRDVQAIGTAVRRAPGAIGQAVKTTATGIGQRLSSLAQSTGRKLAPIGNQILDRAGDALRASGTLDRSVKPNSITGILAQGAGRMLAARAANRTRLGLRMDTASPEQRAALQGRAQSAATRGRVAALTPERRAALKARLGGGQTTTARPRVTAAPDRMARQGGENRNAASAVAVRRGMEDRSIIQGLRRLARGGDRDAASKLATRQEASARTRERIKGKLGTMRQRQVAAGSSGGGGREPSWVGRARFNDRMRQKGETRVGPNTPEVTKARADRAAKRKARQELRGGNADRARAAGETIMAGKETKKLSPEAIRIGKVRRGRELRNRTIRNQWKRTANVVRRNTPSGARPSDSSSILVGGLTEQMKMKLRQRMLEDYK